VSINFLFLSISNLSLFSFFLVQKRKTRALLTQIRTIHLWSKLTWKMKRRRLEERGTWLLKSSIGDIRGLFGDDWHKKKNLRNPVHIWFDITKWKGGFGDNSDWKLKWEQMHILIYLFFQFIINSFNYKGWISEIQSQVFVM
jgi:hypothetical protein